MKLENITGNECGGKLKKFAKITFFIIMILAVIVAILGIISGFMSLSEGETGTGILILLIFAAYTILLLFLGYISFLKTYAYGNMVAVQEKQYELLQDLYQKLYDDGTLEKHTDNMEF